MAQGFEFEQTQSFSKNSYIAMMYSQVCTRQEAQDNNNGQHLEQWKRFEKDVSEYIKKQGLKNIAQLLNPTKIGYSINLIKASQWLMDRGMHQPLTSYEWMIDTLVYAARKNSVGSVVLAMSMMKELEGASNIQQASQVIDRLVALSGKRPETAVAPENWKPYLSLPIQKPLQLLIDIAKDIQGKKFSNIEKIQEQLAKLPKGSAWEALGAKVLAEAKFRPEFVNQEELVHPPKEDPEESLPTYEEATGSRFSKAKTPPARNLLNGLQLLRQKTKKSEPKNTLGHGIQSGTWLKAVVEHGVDKIYQDPKFQSLEKEYMRWNKKGLDSLGRAAKKFVQNHFERSSRKDQKKTVQNCVYHLNLAVNRLAKNPYDLQAKKACLSNLKMMLEIKNQIDRSPKAFQSRLSTLIDMVVRESVALTGILPENGKAYQNEVKLYNDADRIYLHFNSGKSEGSVEVLKDIEKMKGIQRDKGKHPFEREFYKRLLEDVGEKASETSTNKLR